LWFLILSAPDITGKSRLDFTSCWDVVGRLIEVEWNVAA